jgi:hypothetical protein
VGAVVALLLWRFYAIRTALGGTHVHRSIGWMMFTGRLDADGLDDLSHRFEWIAKQGP